MIGGGNSGIEAAIDLAGITRHVTVLQFMDQCRVDDALMEKLRSLDNVDVITNAATTEVLDDGRQVTGLAHRDRTTDEVHTLKLSGLFVQIGLVPNTAWLRDSGLELSRTGEIVVDEKGATSIPGVFAAGDCTAIPFKQMWSPRAPAPPPGSRHGTT